MASSDVQQYQSVEVISNLCALDRGTDNVGVVWSVQLLDLYLKIGHEHFLLNPFQLFITHTCRYIL